MADLSDVTSAMADLATAACYPNGPSAPSVTGHRVSVFEGWPLPEQLDQIKNDVAFVSIYPVDSSNASVIQVFDTPQVVVAPVHGMTVAGSDGQATFSGQPNPGEYATVVVGHGAGYTYVASQGDTTSTVAAALATQIAAGYPGTSATGATLTIVGAPAFVVRIGAPGTLGQALHRERPRIQITVWAPNHQRRSIIAAAVDVALKRSFRLTLPDTSQATLTYERTVTLDSEQKLGIYRRDLFYTAEYATIDLFQAYEITAVGITLSAPDATASRSATF